LTMALPAQPAAKTRSGSTARGARVAETLNAFARVKAASTTALGVVRTKSSFGRSLAEVPEYSDLNLIPEKENPSHARGR
jgi:hypothetical protein